MTFQGNVRATFDTRKYAKRVSVLTLALTFFMSMAIGRQSDPVLAYLIFFFTMILVAVVYRETTGRDVLDHPSFRVRAIARPILAFLPIVLAAWLVLYLLFQWSVSAGDALSKVFPVAFASVVVAFVEEFARFVWLQTLPLSPLTANLVWVLLHPEVAVVFAGKFPNVFFAVFAFAFGLLMTGIMWLYETRLPGRTSEAFGPVAAMVVHGGYNALVLLFTVTAFQISFGVF